MGVSNVIRYEERPCRVVQMVALCDCGGELKATGGAYASDPPRYEHVCDACGCEKTLPYAYPCMEARLIEESANSDDQRIADAATKRAVREYLNL